MEEEGDAAYCAATTIGDPGMETDVCGELGEAGDETGEAGRELELAAGSGDEDNAALNKSCELVFNLGEETLSFSASCSPVKEPRRIVA